MDDKLPNAEIVASSGFKQKKDLEKTIKVVILIVAVLALLSAGYYLLSQKSTLPKIPLTTQTSPTPSTTDSSIVAKVGSENLYKADLDYYLSTYFAGQGYGPKDQALDKMINDSIILQEGQKSGYISLNSDVFNSPNKNIASRSALIENSKKRLLSAKVNKIGGEIVSMWFNNSTSYPLPAMGVDKAKALVKTKMDKIHQSIASGTLTLAQAADQIRADSSQNSIDPSFQGNAYRKFLDQTKDQRLFKDQAINDTVWKLGKGELSDVLLVHDFKAGNPFEAYYTIIKINNTVEGNFTNLEQLLEGLRKSYETIVY